MYIFCSHTRQCHTSDGRQRCNPFCHMIASYIDNLSPLRRGAASFVRGRPDHPELLPQVQGQEGTAAAATAEGNGSRHLDSELLQTL